MLTDAELLLCLSPSSIECGVCWRGDHCGMGLFGSALPFASPGHNSELGERVSHTPHSSWGTGNESVCDVDCRAVVSRERCDGNAQGRQECSTQMLDLEESPC